MIVEVASIAAASRDAVATEVPTFESLATLARYCERPILRQEAYGSELYAVEDAGRLYVHRPAPRKPVADVAAAPPAPTPRARAASARRSPALVRMIVSVVALAAAFGLATAFTAANTVPVSYAGVSTTPVSSGQIAPAQCAGINLTNQITMTTNSTGGTAANDLILGRNVSGTVSIGGGSGDDCLVGGGGAGTTNKFDGGAGTNDVCIGAPGATNTFKNCERTF